MKIYLGIPFYGGAGPEFVSSLLKTHVALHLSGYEVEVDMHTNCSVLPKARNEIVMRFIASGFDKLLFLDTDLAWDTVDAFKLVNSEHDISAIDYRKKTDKVEFNAALTGVDKDEWMQATGAGTGLMCITRGAILDMQRAYPQTRYVTDEGHVCFSLFEFQVFNGRFWGEDYTFCRRWVETGRDIKILKNAETSHIGTKAFKGKK